MIREKRFEKFWRCVVESVKRDFWVDRDAERFADELVEVLEFCIDGECVRCPNDKLCGYVPEFRGEKENLAELIRKLRQKG